ncbi:hypothetical protein ABLT15_28060 [Paraburkholderia tropica]|uniref:hypothetical protein n=1 Tax=Paraburkholderia tropica TaxID=92647 RepID=UPI0032B5D3F4
MVDSHVSDIELSKAIQAVLDAQPDLSIYGWHGDHTLPAGALGRYTEDPQWAYRGSARQADRDSIGLASVRTALRFLENSATTRKTINKRVTSYSLKHAAERWGANEHLSSYVANGELILAALLAGFRCERIARSPNCFFNIAIA